MSAYRFLFSFFFFAVTTISYSQDTTLPMKGIGVRYKLDTPRQAVVVTSVLTSNAAAEAGLRDNDILLAINGAPLWPMSTEERSKALRGGANGEPYKMKIERTLITSLGNKQQIKEVTITPRDIETKTCLSGDCKNGHGKMINNNAGISWEGKFVNGDFVQGKTYFKSRRIRSEGSFKNGLIDGPDCTTYYDSEYNASRYPYHKKGMFIAGILRHGTIFSPDGESLTRGTFDEKGLPHGKDIYIKKPKFTYEGEVVHGELTGHAESMTYQNGNYEGPVVKGKPEGKGTWYFSGRKHKGKFVNGLMEGQFQVTENTGMGKYHRVYQYRGGVQQ